MSFRCRQIDQSALGQQIDAATILEKMFLERFSDRSLFLSEGVQSREIDFHIKMARVGHHGTVGHDFEVLLADDIFVSCQRDEDLADPGGLPNGHDLKAIHDRFQTLYRVNFAHHNMGPHSSGPHGHAPSTPAITHHHKASPGQQQIGGSNDPINR